MDCEFIWPHVIGEHGEIALIILTASTMIISGPGNFITGYVIARNETLRSEPAYLLLCSLCVADTLVSTITQPLYMATLIRGPRYSCVLDNIYFAIAWFSSVASTLGVIAVTIDRYFFIVYPLRYTDYMTINRAKFMITTVWITAILFAVIPIFYHKSIILNCMVLLILILLSSVMGYTYKKVYSEIKGGIKENAKNAGEGKKGTKSQNQATRSVLFILLAFFGCWYPWVIVSVIISIHNDIPSVGRLKNNSIFLKLHWIFLCIGYCNSALNVFIYSRKNTVLRGAVEKFLHIQNRRRSEDFTTVHNQNIRDTKKLSIYQKIKIRISQNKPVDNMTDIQQQTPVLDIPFRTHNRDGSFSETKKLSPGEPEDEVLNDRIRSETTVTVITVCSTTE